MPKHQKHTRAQIHYPVTDNFQTIIQEIQQGAFDARIEQDQDYKEAQNVSKEMNAAYILHCSNTQKKIGREAILKGLGQTFGQAERLNRHAARKPARKAYLAKAISAKEARCQQYKNLASLKAAKESEKYNIEIEHALAIQEPVSEFLPKRRLKQQFENAQALNVIKTKPNPHRPKKPEYSAHSARNTKRQDLLALESDFSFQSRINLSPLKPPSLFHTIVLEKRRQRKLEKKRLKEAKIPKELRRIKYEEMLAEIESKRQQQRLALSNYRTELLNRRNARQRDREAYLAKAIPTKEARCQHYQELATLKAAKQPEKYNAYIERALALQEPVSESLPKRRLKQQFENEKTLNALRTKPNSHRSQKLEDPSWIPRSAKKQNVSHLGYHKYFKPQVRVHQKNRALNLAGNFSLTLFKPLMLKEEMSADETVVEVKQPTRRDKR
jgi:hypothetical protein